MTRNEAVTAANALQQIAEMLLAKQTRETQHTSEFIQLEDGTSIDISFGDIGPGSDGLTRIELSDIDLQLKAKLDTLAEEIDDVIARDTMIKRNVDRGTYLLTAIRQMLPLVLAL